MILEFGQFLKKRLQKKIYQNVGIVELYRILELNGVHDVTMPDTVLNTSIFDQSFDLFSNDFRPKFQFLTKFMIFDQNFDF